jgi:hypothetical protein
VSEQAVYKKGQAFRDSGVEEVHQSQLSQQTSTAIKYHINSPTAIHVSHSNTS